MDSILNEYDIPKLYLQVYRVPRKTGQPDNREVSYAIIDGKQRLEAIWGFMDDKFALASDFEYYKDPTLKPGNLRYSQLAKQFPQIKIIFDSFVIPIVCVETDDDDLVQEMFSRLNEAVPLNAAEKRNALGGPMTKTINDVAGHKFFKYHVPFSNKRYQYREVAVRLLFVEHNLLEGKIVDTKKEFLDDFVLSYKMNNLDPKQVRRSVKQVLSAMTKVFVKKDQLLRARASVVIYYLLFRSALRESKLKSIMRDKLIAFDREVEENMLTAEKKLADADFDLLEFNRLSIQGTNDASSIRERLRIITERFKIKPDYGVKRAQ
jgi:hypothetical protein